jgi:hypothetical protein
MTAGDFNPRSHADETWSNDRATSKKHDRFRLVPFRDIVPTTSAAYTIKNLLPREGLVIVWGPPKCGKSFIVIDMVLHVAANWEYRSRRTKGGGVVYIAAEGERGLNARVGAFKKAHEIGVDAERAIKFYLIGTRLDLVKDREALAASIRAEVGETVAVIVVDTLNRSFVGSESDDRDMGLYIAAADALRESFSCAVVVIHHCGIEGTRPRGHTSLTGAVDAQIAVKKLPSGNVSMTVEHMKDGPGGEEIISHLEVVDVGKDEDGETVTSCVVMPVESDGSATSKPRRKLSPGAQSALDTLNHCVAKDGKAGPASDNIPRAAIGVTKDAWKTMLEKRGLVTARDAAKGNGREQFRRFIVTLTDAGLIGVYDDFVWPVTSRHKVSP